MTYTERVGFARSLLEFIGSNGPMLRQAGLDPERMARELEGAIQRTVAENERQEALKASLKAQTRKLNEADRAMYTLASGQLDMIQGALGKGTPAAATIRRLRSRVRAGPRARGA